MAADDRVSIIGQDGKPLVKRNLGERTTYVNLGRPSDQMLSVFLTVIGHLPEMSHDWKGYNYSEQFAHGGTWQLCKTSNYHALVQNGRVVVRLWTDTVKQVLVDFLPELFNKVTATSAALGDFVRNKKTFRQLAVPGSIPKTLKNKTKPCTHRTIIRTDLAAHELAKIVRKQFRF